MKKAAADKNLKKEKKRRRRRFFFFELGRSQRDLEAFIHCGGIIQRGPKTYENYNKVQTFCTRDPKAIRRGAITSSSDTRSTAQPSTPPSGTKSLGVGHGKPVPPEPKGLHLGTMA